MRVGPYDYLVANRQKGGAAVGECNGDSFEDWPSRRRFIRDVGTTVFAITIVDIADGIRR